MEDQLIFAGRMAAVGTLAAGVAHEINNPLAYIVANIDFTRRAAGDADRASWRCNRRPSPRSAPNLDEVLEALGEAREGAERVRNIVRDLKVFGRGNEEARGPVVAAPRARFVDQHGLERDPPPRAPGEGLRRRAAGRRQRVAPRPGVPEPAAQRRAGHPRGRGRAQRDPRDAPRTDATAASSSRCATPAPASRPRSSRASSSRSSPPSPSASAPGSASRSASGIVRRARRRDRRREPARPRQHVPRDAAAGRRSTRRRCRTDRPRARTASAGRARADHRRRAADPGRAPPRARRRLPRHLHRRRAPGAVAARGRRALRRHPVRSDDAGDDRHGRLTPSWRGSRPTRSSA